MTIKIFNFIIISLVTSGLKHICIRLQWRRLIVTRPTINIEMCYEARWRRESCWERMIACCQEWVRTRTDHVNAELWLADWTQIPPGMLGCDWWVGGHWDWSVSMVSTGHCPPTHIIGHTDTMIVLSWAATWDIPSEEQLQLVDIKVIPCGQILRREVWWEL